MQEQFSRTALIYGEEAVDFFASLKVAVFGLGGVGGYVTEALARTGIGALDLIDNDRVCVSNINRQLLATWETVGEYKTVAAARRIASINPACRVRTWEVFYLPETQDLFDFGQYDYVVDAIDTVTGKLAIIENAKKAGVPVISSMGAGNKTRPAAFEVADIYETSICPLAKIMRRECRKRGIDSLKVVYSREGPIRARQVAAGADSSCAGTPAAGAAFTAGEVVAAEAAPAPGAALAAGEVPAAETSPTTGAALAAGGVPAGEALPADGRMPSRRRAIPGSTAFVPSVAGLIMAGEVINDMAERFFRQESEGGR